MFPYGPLYFFLSTLEILDKKHTFSATTWKKTFHSFKISPIWSKSVANLSRICMDNFENPRISRFSWHVRAILNQSWWTRPRMGAKLAGYSNSWGVITPQTPRFGWGVAPPRTPCSSRLPSKPQFGWYICQVMQLFLRYRKWIYHTSLLDGRLNSSEGHNITVKINMFSWLFCELCCLCSCK